MKTHLTKENIQMANSTPTYLLKRNENYAHTKTCTQISIAALIIIA